MKSDELYIAFDRVAMKLEKGIEGEKDESGLIDEKTKWALVMWEKHVELIKKQI